MQRADLTRALGIARVEQLPRYIRRLVRLPAARPDDFFVSLTQAQKDRLSDIARTVRGPAAKPAIFIHGVLPRSGTNFLSDALELHEDIHAHPGRLWEFPLLYVAPGAGALQQEFTQMFRPNGEVLERFELLGYLASGWLAALQKNAGERRILLKCPHVQNITLFRHLFPDDILLLCLRDGRDIVQSSLATFRNDRITRKGLGELAREWRYGAEAILSFEQGGQNAYRNAMVVRYEALVDSPRTQMDQILSHAGLDPDRYDFSAFEKLPIRGSSVVSGNGKERWDQHEKPSDFNPVGRWQSWSPRQRKRFKSIAGQTLIRAGYASDDQW